MTYCVGILVEDGLVMIADTRTNVGLDNISTYRKLNIIEVPGERVLVLASAGNLSLSQSVVSLLTEGLENSGTGEIETLRNASTLFRAAQLVGRAVRQVRAVEGKAFEEEDLPFNLCFLLGGQITGEPIACTWSIGLAIPLGVRGMCRSFRSGNINTASRSSTARSVTEPTFTTR